MPGLPAVEWPSRKEASTSIPGAFVQGEALEAAVSAVLKGADQDLATAPVLDEVRRELGRDDCHTARILLAESDALGERNGAAPRFGDLALVSDGDAAHGSTSNARC